MWASLHGFAEGSKTRRVFEVSKVLRVGSIDPVAHSGGWWIRRPGETVRSIHLWDDRFVPNKIVRLLLKEGKPLLTKHSRFDGSKGRERGHQWKQPCTQEVTGYIVLCGLKWDTWQSWQFISNNWSHWVLLFELRLVCSWGCGTNLVFLKDLK